MWQIYTYAYNGAGQRTAKTANGQTASYLLKNAHGDVMQTIIAYTYDVRNRLVKEENGHSGTTTTYQFDIRNNIT